MVSPRFGPFQFDTSAQSWFGRAENGEGVAWLRQYAALHEIHVSAVTLIERVRGACGRSEKGHHQCESDLKL